jgi:hypothetical protein
LAALIAATCRSDRPGQAETAFLIVLRGRRYPEVGTVLQAMRSFLRENDVMDGAGPGRATTARLVATPPLSALPWSPEYGRDQGTTPQPVNRRPIYNRPASRLG